MAIFIKKDSGDPVYNADFFNQAMTVGDIPGTGEAMAEEVDEIVLDDRQQTLPHKLLKLDAEEYRGLHEMYYAAGLTESQEKYLNNLVDNNKIEEVNTYLQSKQKEE